MKPYLIIALAAFAVATSASAQRADMQIPADQAIDFIGRDATVCGKVESSNFAQNAAGTPTFLHLGAPFPRQPFQVRINGEHRENFSFAPEEALKDKVICARGRIARAANRAEIVVRVPADLALAAD